MFERPSHLTTRQPTGRAFGEAAKLRRPAVQVFNEYGELADPQPDPTVTDIKCATAPYSFGQSARLRELGVDGVRLSGMRQFWTATPVHSARDNTDGDVIEYPVPDGERWRVLNVQAWGPHLYEALAVRQEPQEARPIR